jgi:hypothetical protein
MADAEGSTGIGFDVNGEAADVLDLYGQFIGSIEARVAEVGVEVQASQTELEGAEAVLAEAEQEVHAARYRTQSAENKLRNTRRWLDGAKESALDALGHTSSPANETIFAQVSIEGRDTTKVVPLLESLEEIGADPEIPAGERARLVILGSFPVRWSIESPQGLSLSRRDRAISFVDIDPKALDAIEMQRVGNRHYVGINPTGVRTVYLGEDASLTQSTRDASGQLQIVNAHPLDVQLVRTANEVQQLVGGKSEVDELTERHGEITIGTDEKDTFAPTILAGEAAREFTEWLACSKWLRTAVYVASIDENTGGQPNAVTRLDEESASLQRARRSFNDIVASQVKAVAEIDNYTGAEREYTGKASQILLFTRTAQQYLGISDEALADTIAENLKKYIDVSLAQDLENPARFHVRDTKRYMSSFGDLAQFVTIQVARAGDFFKDRPDIPKRIEGTLEIAAFEKLLENIAFMGSNDKNERKQVEKLNIQLQALKDLADINASSKPLRGQ